MTKQEFLEELRERLLVEGADSLVEENLNFYSNYIDGEIAKGRSEEDVLGELGRSALIAHSILEAAGYEIDGIPDRPAPSGRKGSSGSSGNSGSGGGRDAGSTSGSSSSGYGDQSYGGGSGYGSQGYGGGGPSRPSDSDHGDDGQDGGFRVNSYMVPGLVLIAILVLVIIIIFGLFYLLSPILLPLLIVVFIVRMLGGR